MPRIPIAAGVASFLSGVLLIVLWWIGFRWVALLGLVWISVLTFGLLTWFKVPVEKLLVYTMVLSNSIRMDVHIVYLPGGYGFPINNGEICLVCALILWCIRARRDARPLEWPRRYVIPLALLFLGAAISVVQTPDWSTRLRMLLYCIETELTLFYLWNFELDERDYRRLCIGVSIAMALQGMLGLAQAVTHSALGLQFFGASNAAINTNTFTGFTRVGGTLGQPNRFALFMNSAIFVPLALVLASKSGRGRLINLMIFLAAFGALVMTQSRGGWMGFGCAFVPFAYLLLRDRMGRFHAAFTLGFILVFGLASAVSLPPIYARLTAEDSNAAAERVPMAKTALRMMYHNPFGVGFDQYVSRMNAYDGTPDGLSYHFRFPVHDAYLILAAEQGVWVLLVYIVFFCVYYRDVFRLIRGPPSFIRTAGLAFAAGMWAVHVSMNVELGLVMLDLQQFFVMGMVLNAVHYVQRQAEAAKALALPAGAPLVTNGRAGGVAPATS
jgi:hypothetical protein